MAKLNLSNYSRPAATPETRTFTDPLHPGVEIEFTLKPLDRAEQLMTYDLAEALIEQYIGDPKAKPPVKPKGLFPPIDGRPVRLSRNLFMAVAGLFMMQAGKPEDQYSPEQLVEFWIKFPTAFDEIGAWCKELGKPVEVDSGNAPLEPAQLP